MRSNWFVIGLLSLILALRFSWSMISDPPIFADDGLFSLTCSGNFCSGITITPIGPVSSAELSSTWTWTEAEDYFIFEDSTTTQGFRVRLYMSSSDLGNFVYNGYAEQENIDVSNFFIFSNYSFSGNNYWSATKGVDSASAVLNIDSANSCLAAQTLSYYEFNPVFTSASFDYGLEMSASPQTYLTSSVDCRVAGDFDIRRARLNFPGGTHVGFYTSTLVIVLIDGF